MHTLCGTTRLSLIILKMFRSIRAIINGFNVIYHLHIRLFKNSLYTNREFKLNVRNTWLKTQCSERPKHVVAKYNEDIIFIMLFGPYNGY
jgi:hypothetical protein